MERAVKRFILCCTLYFWGNIVVSNVLYDGRVSVNSGYSTIRW